MSQHLRHAPAVAISALFAIAVGCGHLQDPAGSAEGTGASPGTGGTPGVTGGMGGSAGTGASGGSAPLGGGVGAGGDVGPLGGAGGTVATLGGDAGDGGTVEPMACTDAPTQQWENQTMPSMGPIDEAAVNTLMGLMESSQRIQQMLGVDGTAKDYQDIERSPDVPLPDGSILRGYRYRDAGRGVNMDAGQDNVPRDGLDYSTVFPAPSIRAASFDIDLEYRVGMAMGDETAASKNNMLLAPCMNIIRHPYWGRTQETYGEDTYHVGRMASAFTAGLQKYVIGCAKHFSANNVEKNRANQDAVMNEQTLREMYGRHFEMVIRDGGIGCIMASYNKINGVKDTQNKHLLTDILRNDFGYRGFVLSDWWAMPGGQNAPEASIALADATEAVDAGLDVELPWTNHFSVNTLSQVSSALVDQAARRIVGQKVRFNTVKSTDPWGLTPSQATLSGHSLTNPDHVDLTEETEIKSAVLLKNGPEGEPVLPFEGIANVAVIGADVPFTLQSTTVPKSCSGGGTSCTFHFSTDVALGDRGSSRVNGDPAQSIGPFTGILGVGADHGATNVTSGNSAAAAADADAVVVIVGYTPGDEGEEYAIASGGDRTSLDLPANQNQLVADVLALNKPTVIVIESGSIVNLPWLAHDNQNQATVWAGYGGLRGGQAIARLLFGEENFSGKVPLAWPQQADLPQFKDSDVTTTMGYFFGYRLFDQTGANLVFPFGAGISYTTFEYSNLQIPCSTVTHRGIVEVTVDIHNTGGMDGEEVAMLFVAPPPKPDGITGDRPVKELKGFNKAPIPAGGGVRVTLPLRIDDLRRWEGGANGRYVIDDGDYTIMVGPNAGDLPLTATVTVEP